MMTLHILCHNIPAFNERFVHFVLYFRNFEVKFPFLLRSSAVKIPEILKMMKLSCPEQIEKIQKDLLSAIGDKDNTDLAIICEGNVKLLAHKIVLATVSPFLK
jgi:hypothetical protein